jgi:pseudomonalisin
MITLGGNTHPMARAEFDRGDAPADLPMQQMQLVLTRSAAQQADLDALLTAQQDSSSPQYHQWLTPEQFGQRFGASDEDVQKISGWLEGDGFHIDRVANGRNLIEFTGAASQVENTFHTQIHRYMVNGQSHWANASNPEIPAALAGVVAGIATLHDFRKAPQAIRSVARPQFTTSGGGHALGPADYATIYDINPLLANGINGSGVTIAVVGRSDINVSDVVRFRSIFGLSNNPPQVVYNGPNPGVLGNGEVDEATLDVTWAGAVAPNATVKLVVSASKGVNDGVDLSEAYIIDHNLADIMTESFGSCEGNATQAQASFLSNLAAQAAAQGITYVVSAGDSGAEGCDDASKAPATHSVSVNVLASTPYNIAVGGTQFNEGAGPYWNAAPPGTARSYIPENVWNESCAPGTCSSPALWAGGGGASIFVTKPSWQAGVAGIPQDNHRYLPDVSLTAAGHDPYALCLSCTTSNDLKYYGGTSVSTASFAGIMALVVQKTGARQGQANVTLYQLAAQQQPSQCASTLGVSRASNCIFNDITVGNNAVPGEIGYGTSTAAYQATSGYDLASGLGSVDVANLVNGWGSGFGANPQIRFTVDSPLSAPVAGITKISGWALADTAEVSSVAIAVDGVSYGNATYGAPRGDVCAVYAIRPGCPNVGWSFPLDTTLLADGSHVLDVVTTAATGQKYTGTSNFTVANAAAANPMHIYVDVPALSSSVIAGPLTVSGWALDNLAAISQVSVAIDGNPADATYGLSRTDVCAAYPGRIGCPNVGWSIFTDTSFLAGGSHTLAVTATTASGRASVVSSSFQTTNSSGAQGTVVIDLPNAQTGALSGPVRLYGWALSGSGSPVSRVKVAIDGTWIGDATYGDQRSDVCAVYPGRVGCPSVGWHLQFDTTLFPDGPHTLQVTEFDGGNRSTVTNTFTIANGGNAVIPTKLYIDQPTPQATLLGIITISGWALNNDAAITGVAIFVDGVLKGRASYGANRGDVCGIYTGPGCPNVGWTFSFDTTQLANGPHVLQVTASAITSGQPAQYGTTSTVFTTANWTTNPTRITVDGPARSGSVSGVVNAYGWAMDDYETISSVAISIDGVSYGAASYGSSRGDVCAAFPGRAGCPNVGWNFMLDTTLLSDGPHVLGVTTTTAGGRHSTVTSPFSVSNATGNSIQVTIDAPASNATVAGAMHTYGWALDGGIGITSVQILVDGSPYGPVTYGDSRTDVCAVYSGLGCPNVGWDFSLDTTGLANGTHTFAVRALGADGVKRTVSNSFQVLNDPSLKN